MNYYELKYRVFFDKNDGSKRRQIGKANGEKVPNGKPYFDRIGEGEIIKDAPVFDYFFLKSFDRPQFWEWRLQDIHGFIGEYPTGGCFYISDRFKKLLEQFTIAKGFWFYPTKLLYKGEKHDYWIFQYATIEDGISNKSYVDLKKSTFFDDEQDSFIKISNYEELKLHRNRIKTDSEYEKDLVPKQIVLNQAVDFIPMYRIINSGVIISERLKIAIEEAELEGFEFSDLDYEVVVENKVNESDV